MNKLSNAKRTQVVAALIEGCSIRSTVRMTGVAKNTIVKLLADLGEACMKYQDQTLRNLPCKRIEVDECWSFCYAKAANVPVDKQGIFGYGDVWTWVSLCAECKLVPAWLIGRRDVQAATVFMRDLASRLSNRVQLTSDGHRPYLRAVESAFGCDVDYAMLQKIYGPIQEDHRYSPGQCIGVDTQVIMGNPDPDLISTSYIERQNLSLRMGNRRFTRLTNAFSKKVQNLCYSLAIHYLYYNFARQHQTLRTSPAQAAGITDKLWDVEDIVALLD